MHMPHWCVLGVWLQEHMSVKKEFPVAMPTIAPIREILKSMWALVFVAVILFDTSMCSSILKGKLIVSLFKMAYSDRNEVCIMYLPAPGTHYI